MKQLNRVLAALLSLLIVVAGVLLIIEVIADRINHRPAIVHWHTQYNWLHRTTWTAGSVRTILILCVVVGLILLIAELKRPRVSRLAVEPGKQAGPTDAAYTRRGVAAATKSAVLKVDGVRSASVKVSHRKVKVTAGASATDQAAAAELTKSVTDSAQQRLDSLGLKSTPTLRTRVESRKH